MSFLLASFLQQKENELFAALGIILHEVLIWWSFLYLIIYIIDRLLVSKHLLKHKPLLTISNLKTIHYRFIYY